MIPSHDQRGAETGAEAEEEHLAALVAAQRLHRGIVDHLDRTPEGGLEVEADPSLPRLRGSATGWSCERLAPG